MTPEADGQLLRVLAGLDERSRAEQGTREAVNRLALAMTTLEQSLSRRIDGLEYRVSSLEENVGEVREEVGSSHDLEVEALRAQIVEAKAKQSDARKLAAEQSTWLQRHGVTAITSALVAFLVAGCNAIASYVATHIK